MRKEIKVKRVYRIRYKWCKTAMLFYLIFFLFSFLTTLMPMLMPLWVFFLLDFLLIVSAAFYVEVVESKNEGVMT